MMSRNPYAPPNADSDEPGAEVLAGGRRVRPIGVWMMLATLATMFVMNAVAIERTAKRFLQPVEPNEALLDRIEAFGAHVGLSLILALFLFAIHRQWPAGRWIGIAVICLLGGFAIIDAMSWMRTRGDLSQCVVEVAFGFWWAYAFAFSSKARRYFAPADTRRPMARGPDEAVH